MAGLALVSGGLFVGYSAAIGMAVSDGRGLVSAKIMFGAAILCVLLGSTIAVKAVFRLAWI